MQRRWGRPKAVGVAVAAVLAVTVAPAEAPGLAEALPAARAATTSDPTCTDATPPSIASGGFTLPAWSDGAGWTRPELYETILAGDVDGDGWGELMGRSGSTFDVYTWSKGYNPTGRSYTPTPGNWTPVVPLDLPPDFSNADYFDPSRYSAFRLANIDGQPGDELVAKGGSGITVYRWSTATKTWDDTSVIAGPPWGDADWGPSNPERYLTITTGDVNGDTRAEIIGNGPSGVETWGYTPGATAMTRLDTSPGNLVPGNFDPAGWMASTYETLQLADTFPDRPGAELVARDPDLGLRSFTFGELSGQWGWWELSGAYDTDWTDANGWGRADTYATIGTADLDGNGSKDVFGRGPFGLEAWTYVPNTPPTPDGSWQRMTPKPTADAVAPLSDSVNWNAGPWYWGTVQAAHVISGTPEQVLARQSQGAVALGLVPAPGGGWAWSYLGDPVPTFSDNNAFDNSANRADSTIAPDMRSATVMAVTTQPGVPQMVIGRTVTGVRTVGIDGSDPSAGFAPYTDLTGTPAGLPALTGPPDLATLTPEGRAFWYLDAKAAQSFGDITTEFWAPFDSPDGVVEPARPTVIDQYRNTLIDTSALAAALAGYAPTDEKLDEYNPGVALNVSRSTYNQVRQDVVDWTTSADKLRLLLGIATDELGIRQINEQGFVANAGQVDNIKTSFESNPPKFLAWLSNLIWGVVGGLGAFTGFLEEGEKLTKAAITKIQVWGNFAASVTGAGAAIGINSPAAKDQNANMKLDAFADTLETDLVNTFCGSSLFVDLSYDQIVQDYGLLTAGRQFADEVGSTADIFDTIVSHMNTSQDLWIWQQFAGRDPGSGVKNWWVGVCDKGNSCSNWKTSDPDVWVSPENPEVSMRLVESGSNGGGPSCGNAVLKKIPAFADLSPANSDWTAPRQLDGAWAGYANGSHGSSLWGNIGVNGWILGTGKCD